MGRISYSMIVSLDGFIEGPSGSIGFSEPSEDLHRYANDTARGTGVYLLGRGLYEMMEPYWPDVAAKQPGPDYVDEFARIWVDTPRIVFSNSLGAVGPGCELRKEIDPDEIRKLKAETDGTVSVGGASLASDFAALGLIDEVELLVQPVIVGGGKPMFGNGFDGLELKPSGTRTFDSGALVLSYRMKAR